MKWDRRPVLRLWYCHSRLLDGLFVTGDVDEFRSGRCVLEGGETLEEQMMKEDSTHGWEVAYCRGRGSLGKKQKVKGDRGRQEECQPLGVGEGVRAL